MQKWMGVKHLDSEVYFIELESKWNIKFPQFYKNHLMEKNAGTPYLNEFLNKKNESFLFSNLLDLISDDCGESRIIKAYDLVKNYAPKGVVPFADAGFGNYLCFDYRHLKNGEPIIVDWFSEEAVAEEDIDEEDLKRYTLEEIQEEAISYVCDSFEELINGLTES